MTRDLLLAIGVCLVVFGVILRGVARSHRRTIALRRQHELEVRQAGKPAAPLAHWEKHLSRYANGLAISGLLVVIASFFR